MEKHFSTAILFLKIIKGGISMTLAELSDTYRESARLLQKRLKELRDAWRASEEACRHRCECSQRCFFYDIRKALLR